MAHNFDPTQFSHIHKYTLTERGREGESEEETEVKVAIKKGQRANTQLAYQ